MVDIVLLYMDRFYMIYYIFKNALEYLKQILWNKNNATGNNFLLAKHFHSLKLTHWKYFDSIKVICLWCMCIAMRKFLTERGPGILSFLGAEGRCIYLDTKTESTGQFPPPNDRQDVFGNHGDRSLFPWR